MSSKDVKIITIVGKQNTGKTTLIKELIPKLKERGHTVGALKYNIREFEIDHKGKDTYKYFHSGADAVAISSQDEVAVIKRIKRPLEIGEILERYFDDVSIVIVEGYVAGSHPRIKIIDSQEKEIAKKDSNNNELLLRKASRKPNCFSAKDIHKALDFIENIILHKNR